MWISHRKEILALAQFVGANRFERIRSDEGLTLIIVVQLFVSNVNSVVLFCKYCK